MSDKNDGPVLSGTIEFQKNMSYILDLLVDHLYGGDPHLTIRELIQNAHDAIQELEPRLRSGRVIRIQTSPFDTNPYLEMSDSGIGMNRDQLAENLGVVGSSEKLQLARENPAIIGRFGIGFLSSFIVSDRVEVVSRRHGSAEVWRWRTNDKQNWAISAGNLSDMPEHGTRVRLYFRTDYRDRTKSRRINDLKTVDGLKVIVSDKAYLLPFAIQVRQGNAGNWELANAARAPWESLDLAESAYRAIFRTQDKPFHVRVFNRTTNDPDNPDIRWTAQGAFFFRSPKSLSNITARLYVRRMLVDDQDFRLLPSYAVFATGFVNASHLDLDLARRSVSTFDPGYQWVRRVAHEEFRAAFVEFSRDRADLFATQLWPQVDNTVISRLVDRYQSGDELEKEMAETFLREAGPHVPFYQVDVISGGFGQPIWKTIREMVAEERSDGRVGADGKCTIRYTDSQAPVEKQLLVQRHTRLLDVGRENRVDGHLMSLLVPQDFPDFRLEKVMLDRFARLDPTQAQLWKEVADYVSTGLSFYERTHQVEAEIFEPVDTPVVITDMQVDDAEVTNLRGMLEAGGALAAGNVVALQLLKVLEQLEANKGGMITVHLNAANPLMERLRAAFASSDPYLSGPAQDGLRAPAWRAVLDYFGWRSTSGMIAQDRQMSYRLLERLLDQAKVMSHHIREIDDIKGRADLAEETIAKLEQQFRPETLEQLNDVIVGFVEMVASTERVMSNSALNSDERGRLVVFLIGHLERQLKELGAVPVTFTGDGLLFFIARGSGQRGTTLNQIRYAGNVLLRAAELDQDIRAILDKVGGRPPALRVAMAQGRVQYGMIGPARSLIGEPVVEAARLSAETELYEETDAVVLLTDAAANTVVSQRMAILADLSVVKQDWIPSGLGGHPRKLYRYSG